MFSAYIASLYFPQLLCNKRKKNFMPTVIKRNLFMVFSSHQSLLPVTSMVKSAVMLWDQFWFGVFLCVCVYSDGCFASPEFGGKVCLNQSGWLQTRRLRLQIYVSVCACAQLCTCSPAEELWRHYITTFHACSLCVCVLGQIWERRGGCGVREGWGGGTGAVHFSPFKLNVTQTTPLAHALTHARTHFFFLQRIWQKKTFSICQNVCEFLKRKHREMEREVVTHKKSTQSSQSDAVSRRVKGSLVWLPEELPLNWTVCVYVCVSRPARQTY